MAKGQQQQEQQRRDKNTKVKMIDSFSDQLDRASAQLQMAGQRIGQLHAQWKFYLSGLSYIVMYLSFHQLRTRIKACSSHLELAKIQGGSNNASIIIIGMDSAALLVGLMLSILLCFYLRSCSNSAVARFSHPFFLTAQVSAISATVLYWIRTHSNTTTSAETNDAHLAKLSCVEPDAWTDEMRTIILDESFKNNNNNNAMPFPCSVVFHVMVALSLWFMNYQRQQHITNISKVDSLRDELGKGTKKNR